MDSYATLDLEEKSGASLAYICSYGGCYRGQWMERATA